MPDESWARDLGIDPLDGGTISHTRDGESSPESGKWAKAKVRSH
ncbi:hypothetical protein MTBUT4_340027 [Magnetospirillum sp. UT-4]|nr:hypothetical protein MTBUT4_340027 [Magnetospirillum sp. UT-4]